MDASTDNYVKFFRQSSPYIHKHRGSTFVIMLPGEALECGNFSNIIHDIALLSSLGIRLVLVYGARPQINQRLGNTNSETAPKKDLRITDKNVLPTVIDAVGSLRVRLEAELSMGLINSPMHGARIRVASGNYVTARPLGVVDGVDFLHTGEVRRVDRKAIQQQLDNGYVVLLSCLGFSPTGEVFNVPVEEVATRTANAIDAEKLIMFSNHPGITDAENQLIKTMRPQEAREQLQSETNHEFQRLLEAALIACDGQVGRTHIVSHHIDGVLLQELFTRDGMGTLITQDMGAYEQMRPADINDVGGILNLIRPLEDEGVLVRRSRKQLERDINRFTVISRDGMVIGCASLHEYPEDNCAELACLVIHPDYRNGLRGDILLEELEQQTRHAGLSSLFVLTTRTAHWFIERGFSASRMRELPKDKQDAYSRPRNSKVFSKFL